MQATPLPITDVAPHSLTADEKSVRMSGEKTDVYPASRGQLPALPAFAASSYRQYCTSAVAGRAAVFVGTVV